MIHYGSRSKSRLGVASADQILLFPVEMIGRSRVLDFVRRHLT